MTMMHDDSEEWGPQRLLKIYWKLYLYLQDFWSYAEKKSLERHVSCSCLEKPTHHTHQSHHVYCYRKTSKLIKRRVSTQLNSTLFVPNRGKQTANKMMRREMNGWNRTKRHRNALTIALLTKTNKCRVLIAIYRVVRVTSHTLVRLRHSSVISVVVFQFQLKFWTSFSQLLQYLISVILFQFLLRFFSFSFSSSCTWHNVRQSNEVNHKTYKCKKL